VLRDDRVTLQKSQCDKPMAGMARRGKGFVEKPVDMAKTAKLGDPALVETQVGP
jgi:hypothetical protein